MNSADLSNRCLHRSSQPLEEPASRILEHGKRMLEIACCTACNRTKSALFSMRDDEMHLACAARGAWLNNIDFVVSD